MDYKNKSNILRALSLISTTEASSGHPTSCLSSADLITVLFDKFFHFDINDPRNSNNDKLIFSKGHAAPLLYSAFAMSGVIKRQELLSLRKYGSRLEGHPTRALEFVSAATGSLGQGLSIGAGMALNAKKDNLSYRTFVLLGDGEIAEGGIYEASNFSAYYNLDKLIVIADINGLGTRNTMFSHNLDKYQNLFSSLGFSTFVIDGHNFPQIEEVLNKAVNNKTNKPFIILAKTIKGKGISFLEGREDFHGKALNKEDLKKALKELNLEENIIKNDSISFSLNLPEKINKQELAELTGNAADNVQSSFNIGEEVSTREAFGFALKELGKLDSKVFVFDADLASSTYVDKFQKEFSDRFVECFIAEQNMVNVAQGFSSCGKITFVATYGAFLTRAFDQIRMSNISNANIKFVGSHAGVSVGEDGPSQMGLEDMAMFLPFPNSVILHPCDAVSSFKLTLKLIEHQGMSYLRTLRPKTKVIYKNEEDFYIGGAKILRRSDKDKLVVIVSGITVFEALDAYEKLKELGINICVIDAYSIKPFDKKTVIDCFNSTEKRIVITAEDHYIHGGLGDIVLSELKSEDVKIFKLGITKVPSSGDKNSLLDAYGISSKNIVYTVRSILR